MTNNKAIYPEQLYKFITIKTFLLKFCSKFLIPKKYKNNNFEFFKFWITPEYLNKAQINKNYQPLDFMAKIYQILLSKSFLLELFLNETLPFKDLVNLSPLWLIETLCLASFCLLEAFNTLKFKIQEPTSTHLKARLLHK